MTLLELRVHTSRLLGGDPSLVLHGGGNTSVKIDNVLWVKGSGWDLATIEKEGFPAVNMETLLEIASCNTMSDSELVARQKEGMLNPTAPSPSIEAVVHALIPFTFVDHTHADAIVTISNTPHGRAILEELYGEKVVIVPYVMPGFILAKAIQKAMIGKKWDEVEAIILEHHGVFTFDNDGYKSYEKMIAVVEKARRFLENHAPLISQNIPFSPVDTTLFEELISALRGKKITAHVIQTPQSVAFSSLYAIAERSKKGLLTPEHVIRLKPFPLYCTLATLQDDVERFIKEYTAYFNTYNDGTKRVLDLAPRWGIIQGLGVVVFGSDDKEVTILGDLVTHTLNAFLSAIQLGGWESLTQEELFGIEYWELEQAKLGK